MTDPLSAAQAIRAGTAAAHDAVDAAFGGHDLADPLSYRGLLTAHARALLPAEAWLALQPNLSRWRARGPVLLADLEALGVPAPEPLAFAPLDAPGAGWGVLYVLEGSRLGNAMLVRSVPAALPSAYMASRHLSGEWRALLAAIDAAGLDDDGCAAAIDAARATFDLFLEAAGPAR